ncbi:MAG: hypothetical protein HZA02_08890 [Nitrospinae bacterium]|nr:hypothetical protein [Nitrospinota bacterium]
MNCKIAAVIQARTGSTRCPGKVFRKLAGIAMIEHIIKRVQQVPAFDRIVLAVPDSPAEDGLVAVARGMGIDSIKGPEEDVLRRFVMAGESVGAEHILRVCSDSPLIDLELMASLAQTHLEQNADLTVPTGEIPIGTGTEMVKFSSLREISEIADKKPYREHVTAFFYDHPDQYSIVRVSPPAYLQGKKFRLTVDTDRDLLLMEKIYSLFLDPADPVANLSRIVSYLESHPEIADLNADVPQKDWRLEK